MYLNTFYRKKIEKNFLENNKIPGVIYSKNLNILIKINNNKFFFNILKKNQNLKLKLLNYYYNVKIIDINFHYLKKLIFHIDFFIINEKF